MENRDEIRVNLRCSGAFLRNLRETMELVGLNGEAEAARYLITRGAEALSQQLNGMKMFRRVEQQLAPQELLPFMRQAGWLEDEK